jgi:hypothetical protein
MREDTARTVANIVIGGAAIAAAVVVLRVPALRRLAFGLARAAITTGIPVWIAQEVGTAWAASERRRQSPV